mmetsp:Transcript_6851/g.14303  ORF Transcript_6851/g.14303 Transcript_6851/m.14303 type:complete len:88 (-) Transcript_6851:32-295(-)
MVPSNVRWLLGNQRTLLTLPVKNLALSWADLVLDPPPTLSSKVKNDEDWGRHARALPELIGFDLIIFVFCFHDCGMYRRFQKKLLII